MIVVSLITKYCNIRHPCYGLVTSIRDLVKLIK